MEEVAQALSALKREWDEHMASLRRPPRCVGCGHPRIWWDGRPKCSASVCLEGHVVHVTGIVCRRVRCARCAARWRLRPPGLLARKHYQLDVVAQAAATYLFAPRATQQSVAEAFCCSRRTVGRWIRWIGELASPAALLRTLAEIADEPVRPKLLRIARTGPRERIARLARTAEVLTLFEALGAALGGEPPGLRAVLGWLGRVPSYAEPALPDPLPVVAR